MRHHIVATVLLTLAALPAAAAATRTETLLFIRHAEKQADDLGQLTCQGLNRSLALPAVLRRYGKPDALFAPDPAQRNHGYNYVRPLATIEPTAIALGMPINTDYAWNDIDGVSDVLTRSALQDATVWIAWEHKEAVKIMREIAQQDSEHHVDIPDWDSRDFDRISILTIQRNGPHTRIIYRQERQNLDNLPQTCP
jgi:hypothetical protein